MVRRCKRWKTALVVLIGMSLMAPIASASPGMEFGECNLVGTRADYINSVAVGDLDGDGDLDIVTGDDDGDVIAWRNDGAPFDGGWPSQVIGSRPAAITSVAVGDFDSDGNLDIVSGDEADEVQVWENDGTPFTGGWSSEEVVDRGDDILSVAVGDFDGNGFLDIVSGDKHNHVMVYQNDGTPFGGGSWTSQVVGSVSANILSVAVGDFDGNGDPDIVSGDEDNNAVIVWRNDGSPFSDAWTSQVVGTREFGILSVAVGDFDGNGKPDIVSGGYDERVVAWKNDGSPFAGGWYSQTVGTRDGYIYSVAVGDMDCNGTLDVVSGDDDEEVIVWENDGTPFDDGWSDTVVRTGNDNVLSVAVGDLDGDYSLDIVSGDEDYEVMACENLGECWPPVGGYSVLTRGYDLLLSWLRSVLAVLR